ncbi:MAG: hypothetical protein H6925_03365 [Holosporaceae bacterium]|nr:MAG: hypothetical protein H6925_03365 [Holosporaceae bacterium]
MAKYSSYLVVFIIFCVPAAPAIGGVLEETFGWKSNFMFMGALGMCVLFFLMVGFKETLKASARTPLSLKGAIQKYGILFKSPVFMGIGVPSSLPMGAHLLGTPLALFF